MISMTTVGRVTKDFELKEGSNNGIVYVNFSIAVNGGYGDKKTTTYFDCTAFDFEARRLVKASVKKGSLIQVTGDFSVSEYHRNDGSGTGYSLRLHVLKWAYIPGTSGNKDANGGNTTTAAQAIETSQDGYVPVITATIDDDDLPF